MTEKKIDYQKINSLCAKWRKVFILIEQHTIAIQELQKEIHEINQQIAEEERKIKK